MLGGGRTVSIDVSQLVPPDSDAAVFSVTATAGCIAGYLTVFACGAQPPTSNLNYEVGRTTAGLAITPLTDGKACIFASTSTDVIVDVMGAFTPDGDRFHPMPPTRWIDTRGGDRATHTDLRRQGRTDTDAVGDARPRRHSANATAVWLNLTVADPTAATVLTAYPGPCGTPPLSSNVNARPQHSTASSVLVGIGTDGSVCVLTYSGNSHIVVDVAGWFGPGSGGLGYRPRQPVRLADTRLNGGVPTNAETGVHVGAVSVLNVIAVDSAAPGYVTARPCGSTLISSLINTTPNEDTANVIAVGGDVNGNVCVRSNIKSHLVVDQVATFEP